MKRLALFQTILAAVVLTVLRPSNNGEWFTCLVVLVVGEAVVYRDLRALHSSAVAEERARSQRGADLPPKLIARQRFLEQSGWPPNHRRH